MIQRYKRWIMYGVYGGVIFVILWKNMTMNTQFLLLIALSLAVGFACIIGIPIRVTHEREEYRQYVEALKREYKGYNRRKISRHK